MIGHKIAQLLEQENNLFGTTRKTIGPKKLGLKTSNLIKKDFDDVFATGIDSILTPTTPSAAFALGGMADADPLEMYLNDVFTVTVNLAGLPGISVPTGLDKQGLPLGLQLIGRPWEEADLLNSAYALEQASGFAHKPQNWWAS